MLPLHNVASDDVECASNIVIRLCGISLLHNKKTQYLKLQTTANDKNIYSYIIKGHCTDTGEYCPSGYLRTLARSAARDNIY